MAELLPEVEQVEVSQEKTPGNDRPARLLNVLKEFQPDRYGSWTPDKLKEYVGRGRTQASAVLFQLKASEMVDGLPDDVDSFQKAFLSGEPVPQPTTQEQQQPVETTEPAATGPQFGQPSVFNQFGKRKTVLDAIQEKTRGQSPVAKTNAGPKTIELTGEPQTGEMHAEVVNGKLFYMPQGMTAGGEEYEDDGTDVNEDPTGQYQSTGVLMSDKGVDLNQSLRDLVTSIPKEKRGLATDSAQQKRNEERGKLDKAKDYAGVAFEGAKRVFGTLWEGVKNVGMMLSAGAPTPQLDDNITADRRKTVEETDLAMIKNVKAINDAFQQKAVENNIETSVLNALDNGNYWRIPEAAAYTMGDMAMQIVPAMFTGGASMYFQTLPDTYTEGVEQIAKEKGITVEEVIRTGQDAKLIAMSSAGLQALMERLGVHRMSNAFATKGGYKAVRDWMLKLSKNPTLARLSGVLYTGVGGAVTEAAQDMTTVAGGILAKSKDFVDFTKKFSEDFWTPENQRRYAENAIAGLLGEGGIVTAGRTINQARNKFERPVVGQAPKEGGFDAVIVADRINNKKDVDIRDALNAESYLESEIAKRGDKASKDLLEHKETISNYIDSHPMVSQRAPTPPGATPAPSPVPTNPVPPAPGSAPTGASPTSGVPVDQVDTEVVEEAVSDEEMRDFLNNNRQLSEERFAGMVDDILEGKDPASFGQRYKLMFDLNRDKIMESVDAQREAEADDADVVDQQEGWGNSYTEGDEEFNRMEDEGVRMESNRDAMKFFDDGYRVFVVQEQDGSITELTSADAIQKAGAYELIALPPAATSQQTNETTTTTTPSPSLLGETTEATGQTGGGVGTDVQAADKGGGPTKESVTERLGINHPFYQKVSDALAKLGLIQKYNPEKRTGDALGGYVQEIKGGGFSSGKFIFNKNGDISYLDGDIEVTFDQDGNVVSENTEEAKQKKATLEIEGRKDSIDLLKKTRDSEDFKYKTITTTDDITGEKKTTRRLKTAAELKESTDKINAAISKAEAELAALQSNETPLNPAPIPVAADLQTQKPIVAENAVTENKDAHNSLLNKVQDYNAAAANRKGDALSIITKAASKLGYSVGTKGKTKIQVFDTNGKPIKRIATRREPEIKPTDDQITKAKKLIDSGNLDWNGDIWSPRPNIQIDRATMTKGLADIRAGKTDTESAKAVVKEANRLWDLDELTFSVGPGKGTPHGAFSISEALKLEEEFANIDEMDISDEDLEDGQLWWDSLTQEEKDEYEKGKAALDSRGEGGSDAESESNAEVLGSEKKQESKPEVKPEISPEQKAAEDIVKKAKSDVADAEKKLASAKANMGQTMNIPLGEAMPLGIVAQKGNPDLTRKVKEAETAVELAKRELEKAENQLEKLKGKKTSQLELDTEKKEDSRIKVLQDNIDAANSKIQDLQDEIKIEEGNLKIEKDRIKTEIAAARDNKNLSKEERQQKIEDLRGQLQDVQDDHDSLVDQYKEDIASEKAEMKREQKELDKLNNKEENTEDKDAIRYRLLKDNSKRILKESSDILINLGPALSPEEVQEFSAEIKALDQRLNEDQKSFPEQLSRDISQFGNKVKSLQIKKQGIEKVAKDYAEKIDKEKAEREGKNPQKETRGEKRDRRKADVKEKLKSINADLDKEWDDLDKLIGGKAFSNPADPAIIAAVAKTVAKYIQKGVYKLEDIAADVEYRLGTLSDQMLNAIKEAYLSNMRSVEDDVLDEMDDVKTVRKFQLQKQEEDVSDRSGDSQSNSDDAKNTSSANGKNVQSDRAGGGTNGNGSQKGGDTKNQQPENREGTLNIFTPAIGEQSNQQLSESESGSRNEGTVAGTFDGRGNSINGTKGDSGVDANGGKDFDESTQQVSGSFADKQKLKLIEQNKAESIPVKRGDLANIRATLPYLLPEQQEDVLKAEQRFFDPEHKTPERGMGKGMLFTNGTGTGKTFTGLGIIKRFVKEGKDNILIVVPSQPKVTDWAEDGRALGLNITPLSDTKTGGKGVVITTYANFRANDELAKRDFDLVVYDEAHRLMESKQGETSSTTGAHYEFSNKNASTALSRITSRHPLWIKAKGLNDQIRSLVKIKNLDDTTEMKYAQLDEEQKKLEAILVDVEAKKKEALPALEERAKRAAENTKVVFLSATPFKAHFNLRYANGFLFDWGTKETTQQASRGPSRVDPESRFMLDNFGAQYEWKYHQLQNKGNANPEAVAMQEIEFSEKLKKAGAMSGRVISSDQDYAREFPLVTGFSAQDFNRAFNDIFDYSTNVFPGLRDAAGEVFMNYNYTTKLFEALKTSAAIPRIQEHLDLGRKVVVFHRRKQAGVIPPFENLLNVAEMNAKAILSNESSGPNEKDKAASTLDQVEMFRAKYKDLLAYEQTLNYNSTIDQIQEAFPGKALYINGDVSVKDKNKAIKDFNTDGSGIDIIVVQEEAGKEGISLHDRSGKHQRVLISMSMPISTTTALQVEGRIYRIGQESDAIFEYPLLGLDLETAYFGQNINKRLSTTENLAVGADSRDLIRSYSEGVLFNATGDKPSKRQGKGGKAFDKRMQDDTSPYKKARLIYSTNQKLRGKRDQRQGVDFYPTPEPLGQKMVEWAKLNDYEHMLEPSAGMGSIAMWTPSATSLTAIEPSFELYSKLGARAGGGSKRILNQNFEDLALQNKYDAVVMNPPFGTGGKLAMDHLAKAFRHVVNGGRVVALIPAGGSMDKRLDDFLNGTDEKGKLKNPNAHLVADIALPSVTFEQAGTSVNGRVVIIDRIDNVDESGMPSKVTKNLSGAKTIEDFFDQLENVSGPDRKVLKTEAEKTTEEESPKEKPKKEKAQKEERDLLDPQPYINTKTGDMLTLIKPGYFYGPEKYRQIADQAKENNGYYSKYAKGFLFKKSEDAQKFFDAVNGVEQAAPTSLADRAINAIDNAIRQIDEMGPQATFLPYAPELVKAALKIFRAAIKAAKEAGTFNADSVRAAKKKAIDWIKSQTVNAKGDAFDKEVITDSAKEFERIVSPVNEKDLASGLTDAYDRYKKELIEGLSPMIESGLAVKTTREAIQAGRNQVAKVLKATVAGMKASLTPAQVEAILKKVPKSNSVKALANFVENTLSIAMEADQFYALTKGRKAAIKLLNSSSATYPDRNAIVPLLSKVNLATLSDQDARIMSAYLAEILATRTGEQLRLATRADIVDFLKTVAEKDAARKEDTKQQLLEKSYEKAKEKGDIDENTTLDEYEEMLAGQAEVKSQNRKAKNKQDKADDQQQIIDNIQSLTSFANAAITDNNNQVSPEGLAIASEAVDLIRNMDFSEMDTPQLRYVLNAMGDFVDTGDYAAFGPIIVRQTAINRQNKYLANPAKGRAIDQNNKNLGSLQNIFSNATYSREQANRIKVLLTGGLQKGFTDIGNKAIKEAGDLADFMLKNKVDEEANHKLGILAIAQQTSEQGGTFEERIDRIGEMAQQQLEWAEKYLLNSNYAAKSKGQYFKEDAEMKLKVLDKFFSGATSSSDIALTPIEQEIMDRALAMFAARKADLEATTATYFNRTLGDEGPLYFPLMSMKSFNEVENQQDVDLATNLFEGDAINRREAGTTIERKPFLETPISYSTDFIQTLTKKLFETDYQIHTAKERMITAAILNNKNFVKQVDALADDNLGIIREKIKEMVQDQVAFANLYRPDNSLMGYMYGKLIPLALNSIDQIPKQATGAFAVRTNTTAKSFKKAMAIVSMAYYKPELREAIDKMRAQSSVVLRGHRGEVDNRQRYQKRQGLFSQNKYKRTWTSIEKFGDDISTWLGDHTIAVGDDFVTNLALVAGYLDNLNQQGKSTANFDIVNAVNDLDQEALSYAELLVDEVNAPSDPTTKARILRTDPNAVKELGLTPKQMLYTLKAFTLSSHRNLKIAYGVLADSRSSDSEKEEARARIGGWVLSTVMFLVVGSLIRAGRGEITDLLAEAITGGEPPEEEKDKTKDKLLVEVARGTSNLAFQTAFGSYNALTEQALQAGINFAAQQAIKKISETPYSKANKGTLADARFNLFPYAEGVVGGLGMPAKFADQMYQNFDTDKESDNTRRDKALGFVIPMLSLYAGAGDLSKWSQEIGRKVGPRAQEDAANELAEKIRASQSLADKPEEREAALKKLWDNLSKGDTVAADDYFGQVQGANADETINYIWKSIINDKAKNRLSLVDPAPYLNLAFGNAKEVYLKIRDPKQKNGYIDVPSTYWMKEGKLTPKMLEEIKQSYIDQADEQMEKVEFLKKKYPKAAKQLDALIGPGGSNEPLAMRAKRGYVRSK